jgi:peptide/nickel transport system ATP-binding protein
MSGFVEVERLVKRFNVSKPWLNRVLERLPEQTLTAVSGVSFVIEKGQTFALVGESGSGKSTVAKMVIGLLKPTDGVIRVDGQNVHAGGTETAQRVALRRRMQMIFQDPYASLNPRWRIDQIVSEPIRVFGLITDEGAINRRVGELLELVGLDARDMVKYPHEFSGGQRQRLCIARALSSNPELLVCDEPTSALDVSVQAQILNLMRDLQDELGLTYLFISHNLAVVRYMANRIGVMYLGGLVEVSDTKDLFANPAHPYTRMLLDAVPSIAQVGRERQPVQGEIPNPINPPSGCVFHPRCPFANDRCKHEIPKSLGRAGRQVACHAVEEGRLDFKSAENAA